MPPFTRRTFLGSLALVTLAAPRRAAARPPWGADVSPFTLGVASGDPSPDGFVIWTRLAPKPS